MKNLLSISVITLLIISFFVVFSQNDMRAQYESGKWVPEYVGSDVPSRCSCVKSAVRSACRVGDSSTISKSTCFNHQVRSACRVGDSSTKLSLCTGPDTTDPGKGDVNF